MFKIYAAFYFLMILANNIFSQCVPPLTLTTSSTPTTCGLPNGTANVLITDPVGTYTYAWSPGGGNAATVINLPGGNYSVIVTDEHGCSQTATSTVVSSTPITLIPSSVPSQCNASAGSASVVAAGGNPPYTYTWSPSGGSTASASNLAAGNYTVTVADATTTCTATQVITVINSNAPMANVDITPTSCSGATGTGVATISATGGTGNYSYLWPHNGSSAATQTGLVAGSYTVIVMDGVCSVVKTFTMTKEENTLGVHMFTNATTCGVNNGNIIAVPVGGTGPYTYSWSPSLPNVQYVSDLANGNYTVVITDASGCSGTGSSTVISMPLPTIDILSVSNPSCFGASDGYYTYSINGTATLTSPSIYGAGVHTDTVLTYTSTNGICHHQYTVTFVDPPQIVATVNTTPANCGSANGSAIVNVTGGVAPYNYSWLNGATSNSVSGLFSGLQTVEITDASGCSVKEFVNILTTNGPTLTMSSTPATCGNGTASVVATNGTPPYTYAWSPAGGTSSTASGLVAGTYMVTVGDANNCIVSETVVVAPVNTLDILIGGHLVASCELSNGSIYPVVQGQGSSPTGNTYSWMPNGENTSSLTNLPSGNYSVFITDQNGCTGFKEIAIGLIPSQISEVSNIKNPSCHGGNDGGYTVSWIVDGHQISNYLTITGLPAGLYSGGSVGAAENCGNSYNVTLIDPAELVSSINSVNGSCAVAGSATVTASGGTGALSYTWSPSGGSGATASNLSAGNYTVMITDANGCSVNESVTITSSSTLVTTSTSTPASCGLPNGTATVTPNGTAPYTYIWSPLGGTNSTASNLPAGSYAVTVTDATNCSTVETITVGTASAVTATITSTSASCGLPNGTATVTPIGGAAPYTYAWSPSGGIAATASNLPSGNYTVIVTDANNCTVNQSVTVTGTAGVTATTTSTPASCGLPNGTATVIPIGGAAPYMYAWSPSGGITATISNLAAGTHTVIVTDANNCTVNQSVTITSTPGMTVSLVSTPSTCGLSNGTLNAMGAGGVAPYTYVWSPAVGTTANITGLPGGDYTVTVTDANNCSAVETVTLYASSAATATTASTPASCGISDGTATVTPTSTGPYTYAWTPSVSTGATASNLPAGNYTVVVTDGNNCSISNSITVTSSSITATITSTPTSCSAASGSATVTAEGTAPYTYVWSPSGGTAATASSLSAGTYTVTVTDANNCSGSATVTIITPVPPTVTTTATSITCFGQNNGSATATVTGGTAPYTYAWSPSGGTAATASNLTAGSYVVTVTDVNGCIETQTVSVTQPASLAVTTSGNPANCAGGLGSVNAATSGGTGAINYVWQPGNLSGQSQTGLAAGVYSVTATDANGCTATGTSTVGLTGTLTINVNPATSWIDAGDTVAVNATDIPGASYTWSPGTGLSCTNCQDPLAFPTQGTVYTVTVTAPNGCTGTANATININIICTNHFIPTIFSPNSDGNNDQFLILGNCIVDFNVKVFDRWGEKVFESSDQSVGWDGTYKGQPMNPASFVFVANLKFVDGTSLLEKGNLTLVR